MPSSGGRWSNPPAGRKAGAHCIIEVADDRREARIARFLLLFRGALLREPGIQAAVRRGSWIPGSASGGPGMTAILVGTSNDNALPFEPGHGGLRLPRDSFNDGGSQCPSKASHI